MNDRFQKISEWGKPIFDKVFETKSINNFFDSGKDATKFIGSSLSTFFSSIPITGPQIWYTHYRGKMLLNNIAKNNAREIHAVRSAYENFVDFLDSSLNSSNVKPTSKDLSKDLEKTKIRLVKYLDQESDKLAKISADGQNAIVERALVFLACLRADVETDHKETRII